ncbi:MAG TPA: GTP 3',8-cyclase MoaA [Thermodesulfovibrionales bacterium]|nr:GTP 3',8-cyclase MoaA [Thermodesulfovibrionales bacterium]
MKGLKDSYHRTIDYLRVSITDRCNLQCIYCMPSGGLIPIEHKEILRYEEIIRVIRIAAKIGVRKIRITGGEPLVRRNVVYLIAAIKNIPGIEDLSLTTNGILLSRYAEELKSAGLDRVNVSLDTLKPERYREITRSGDLSLVLKGIEAVEKVGLSPLKINMVPICGVNSDEIEEFAKLTLKAVYQVRFIEYMPFGSEDMWSPEKFISTEEIKSIVEGIGPLIPAKLRKSGPARYFRFENAPGVIGFISPISNHFCNECNRLRLTADGKLRPCLFSETEIDLKPALRGASSDDEIERLIKLSIEVKPEGHNIGPQKLSSLIKNREYCKKPMSRIGG